MPKVVSHRQLAANRRNARQSTGPVTPDGKTRSARNALRHGLLSAHVVVSAGDGAERTEEFQALLDSLLEEFDPHDVIEQALVERVAACFWRLRRAQRFEVGALRESLDECQRDDGTAHDEVARLQDELHDARELRDQRANDLHFLQALNLDDPQTFRDARPMLDQLQTRYSGAVWQLPAPQMRDILLRELPQEIREFDEQEIPAIEHRLEEARKYRRLRLERRALAAALPAPEEVLKLVRYENMLDRQLHRALAQLQRRRKPQPPDQIPPEEPR
jgi:hypothetical protein